MASIERDYGQVMDDNMTEYYDEVLNERAISDPRDGLKPIHRKILWAMWINKWIASRPYVKSAKITGAVVGDFHPHGTTSVYDAMVKMFQPWYMNHGLVDRHGNFGSIYGHGPAAERYTEARMDKFAEDILMDGINNDIVDFVPNFDYTTKEPVILPAKIPLGLFNGSFGIAAGYASNIPPHNLNEGIAEIIKYVNDRSHQIILSPDYPTGGILINNTEAQKGYTEGKSKTVLRAKITQDTKKHRLIMTEIPYMKTLKKIQGKIQEATQERIDAKTKKKIPPKIKGIKDMVNNSSEGKIELILEVKKDYDLDLIEAQLYAHTPCEDSLPFDLVGTVDGRFRKYNNVNELVEEWLEFRIVTIKREIINAVKKYKERIHVLEGMMIALDKANIDEVISIIRNSSSREKMIGELMTRFKLTEKQADYIINIKLYRINSIEVSALVEERDELNEKAEEKIVYLRNPKMIEERIVNELKEINKKYKTPRRTVIMDIKVDKSAKMESLIQDSNHTLIFTRRYVKKLIGEMKVQRKGGKGISLGNIKEDDTPLGIFNLNNRDNILMFTDAGKVYSRKVYEIDSCDIKALGYRLDGIFGKESLSNALAMTDAEMKDPNIKIAIGTKLNKIKLVDVSQFANINQNGIIASKLSEGDEVIFARKVDMRSENSIIAATSSGMTIRMALEAIPTLSRVTLGVNIFDGSVINEEEYIAGIDLVTEDITHAFFISKNGLGKRVVIDEFPIQNRGGKGRIGTKAREEDEIVKIIAVNDESELRVISNTNMISMSIEDTSVLLRPAYGNIIKRLNEGEVILDAAVI
jgi:DNA gyrase subunit A